MKKIFLYVSILSVSLLTTIDTNAQQKFPKMDVSPMDAASYPTNWREANKLVKVVYSRPQLKGRELEKLAPKGKVWRTGANEAAEITFYSDVNFGGKDIAAGTYSLFSIPGDDEWTVIISNQRNIWGSYFYKEAEDVARVTASVSESDENIEAFSIVFDGEEDNATMHMGWGKLIVSVPVEKK
ncbi:MAG: DUF2911 domain-containing protein [Flavobacteriaceae bacterium]|nr:DUF2911 domain-containing protein [Flavobacteriaceae bacterium]